MKICSFVLPELEYCRNECNFTDEELEYFNLKAKDKTNVQIAITMNVSESKVSALARNVKKKIKKVETKRT